MKINPHHLITSSVMVDLTSYIMMLKSAQFSPLKHVVDFARIVGTATDRELGTRSNTPDSSNV